MNKVQRIFIFWVVLLSLPLTLYAMSHEDHGSHGHEKTMAEDHHVETMGHNNHGGSHGTGDQQSAMSSDGTMMIVGSMTSKGVKGMAHIKNVSETMSKMGMKTTHHFMMAFVDESTGKQIEEGAVALKITNPDAKVSDAIELVNMDGHFGADIVLDMKGEYHFRLGTKLVDGVKRKYHFHQVIE